jgi:hypothetical protein
MKTRLVTIGGWFAVVVIFCLYIQIQVRPLLDDLGSGIVGLAAHSNDYKHLWLGGMLLAEGITPYDQEVMRTAAGAMTAEDPRFRTILPYVYLPFTALVMRPVTLLPFQQSVVVWQVLNHLMLLASLSLLLWSSGAWGRWGPWSVAAVLGVCVWNHALLRQNLAGQLNVALLLGWSLVHTSLVRGWHPAATGSLAAAAALFKLSPGILILWFLLRRRWAEAAWMAGAGALLLALSMGVFGLRAHTSFIPVLQQMGYGKSTWSELGHTFWRDDYNMSINAAWHRLLVPPGEALLRGEDGFFTANPKTARAARWANLLTWAAVLPLLCLFAVGTWRDRSPAAAASLMLALSMSLLAPSILWDHYLVQLLAPLVVLAALMRPADRRWQLPLLLLAAVMICVPVRFDQLPGREGIWAFLHSFKVIAVLVVFGLALLQSLRPTCGEWEATAHPHKEVTP